MNEVIINEYSNDITDYVCENELAAIALATYYCKPNLTPNTLYINGQKAIIRGNTGRDIITLTRKFKDGRTVVQDYDGNGWFCELPHSFYYVAYEDIKKLRAEYSEHKFLCLRAFPTT